jgi:hypothetical protein
VSFICPEYVDKAGVKHFYNEKLGFKDTTVCLTCEFLDEKDFKPVIAWGKKAIHIGTMKAPCPNAGEHETLASNGVIFWAHKTHIEDDNG